MSEPNAVKIITAIVTLLVGLFSAFIAFYAMLGTHWSLMIICLAISCIFGYFSWLDYNKVIRKTE